MWWYHENKWWAKYRDAENISERLTLLIEYHIINRKCANTLETVICDKYSYRDVKCITDFDDYKDEDRFTGKVHFCKESV